MNRSMQLVRLDQAERHIASGIRYIERQEQLIAGLGHDGCDFTNALDLAYDLSPHENIAHRDRMEELEQ